MTSETIPKSRLDEIVKWLRGEASDCGSDRPATAEKCDQAADAIEALSAQVEELTGDVKHEVEITSQLVASLDSVTAANEVYKEALTAIADFEGDPVDIAAETLTRVAGLSPEVSK